jgi:FAD/FMN-containing dehydrogenase
MSTQLDLPASALGKLDRELRGRLIAPLDEEYNQARSVWNGSIDKFPALIVRAADEADVAAAITFARRHELPLAVRGGAHNVAGSGTCDNGMVIDLGALNSVRVDEAARLAVAGGGTVWGGFDAATAPYGLHTTGGLISTTGIAGLTLGGGIGWLMRKHGLACDNLLGATMITAEGEMILVSETSHPELLWVLRGGGGNFGVATSLTYRLRPLSEVLGGLLLYRAARAARGCGSVRQLGWRSPWAVLWAARQGQTARSAPSPKRHGC